MINIRFHIVSLVAVFLALGVGVAMGASFIDRATVDSMRGRVDDLEAGFRERGDELEQYGGALRRSDEAAAALTEPGSRAVEGMLADQDVVLVLPTELPESAADTLAGTVTNGSGTIVATVTLQPELSPAAEDGEVPADRLEGLRSALDAPPGDTSPGDVQESPGTPSAGDLDTAEDVVVAARSALAEALAVLSAAPPTADATNGDPGAAAPGAVTGPAQPAEDVAGARALLERFADAGLISIDPGGRSAETAFPQIGNVRYLVAIAPGTDPSAARWMVPFAEEYGAASTATMLVAALRSAERAPGDLPDAVAADDGLAALLEPLRSGAASNEVTTVQSAVEPLARLSLVYGLAAQAEGIVGHYGLGEGVAAPYPPAAEE